MTLKAVVDKLDEVPAEFHGEYVEKDGKFWLDLDDTIKLHTAVLPLANTVVALRKSEKDLKAKLAETTGKLPPEGFDADEWTRLREEDEKRKKDPGYKGLNNDEALAKEREKYEQRLAASEQKRVAEVSAKDAVIKQRDEVLERRTKRDDLAAALSKAGVAPHFMAATKALLERVVKCERDETTGEIRTFVDGELGETTVAQYVDNWAKSDDGKVYVVPPAGGGAQGGQQRRDNAENPFSHTSWNVTAQGSMVKEKGLDYAARMAKAAGTTVGGPKPEKRAAA